ncbi:MAG: NAD(P)-dependent oxidoreductase [Candidatus Bathyarchaeia archaeon]
MERFRVYITEPIPMYEKMINLLRRFGVEAEASKVFHEYVPEDKLLDFDGIIVADSKIPSRPIEKTEKLKIIQKFGVGVDNIPVELCKNRQIYVCNIPGINSLDVAEFTLAAILSILHRIRERDHMARKAEWSARPKVLSERLTGKIVGIIGFGRIGRQVAMLLKPFKVKILVYDPYISDETIRNAGVERSERLEQLLKVSDVVTIHTPLTEETRHMIGWRELNIMKRNAILVNTSRGAVVDEEALYRVIKSGRLKSAHIDVWSIEPVPKSNPMLKLRRVQLSLHQASWSVNFFTEAAEFCVENIMRVFKGQKPLNVVWEVMH